MSINDEVIEIFLEDDGDYYNSHHPGAAIDLSLISALEFEFYEVEGDTWIYIRFGTPTIEDAIWSVPYVIDGKVPLYNTNEDVKLFLGSYFGVSHFFRGIIAYFSIIDSDIWDLANYMDGDEIDHIFEQRCPLGRYWSDEIYGCTACHETCTYCVNDQPCHLCHSTCRTCSDTKGPGGIDECTSCFCGAELTDDGRCVAMDNYYGPADSLKLKCQEGCDECFGTGEHECALCSENYEMVEGCPGTCQWCDPDSADENGMPLCGNRGGPFTYQSSCDCMNG
jgi:hypothetical protein